MTNVVFREARAIVELAPVRGAGLAVHQLIHTAWPGDAVTQLALAVRDELRPVVDSEIFAYGLHAEMHTEARPLSALPPSDPAQILLYHLSIGQPELTQVLLGRDDPLILAYHNITPDTYLLDTDPDLAMRSHWGRTELELLRPRVLLAVAYSSFSAHELRDVGYTDVIVSPMGLDPGRLTSLAVPDESDQPRPYLLMVSQLLPHKAIEDGVAALHILQAHLRRDIGLVVVGHPRDAAYASALRRHAEHLGVRNLRWAGRVEDNELAALYRGAFAFLSTSRHEGLGVPTLEAMALGVPVLARAGGAVAETTDAAALLLPPSAGATTIAESVSALLDDPQLRARLVQAGHARAATFTPAGTTAPVLAAIAERLA